MTDVANKHGLRAAAGRRTAKHAQRTPLPPRPGEVEQARELVQYGKMTVRELREAAFKIGIPNRMAMTKGELLNAILLHGGNGDSTAEKAKRAVTARREAKVDATLSFGRSGVDDAFAPKLDPRSRAKADKLAAAAPGWEMSLRGDGDSVSASYARNNERVLISWISGVFQYDGARYEIGPRVIKIRNASHAAKLMSRPETDATAEAERVAANKIARPKREANDDGSEQREFLYRKLNFDPETLSDDELKSVLLGKGVKWRNSISRAVEQAYVSRDPKMVTIRTVNDDDDRTVEFCCPVTGYRAFRESALLRVGAKVDLKTRGSEGSAATGRAPRGLKKTRKVDPKR